MRDGTRPDHTARNVKVIIALALSMSATAAVLLALETPTHGWRAADPPIPGDPPSFQRVTIEVVADEAVADDPRRFGCKILPDGRFTWQPAGGDLRLAIVGPPSQSLPDAQAQTLLRLLGDLSRRGALNLTRVLLAGGADTEGHAAEAVLASDLRRLLVRKGIIE